MGILYLTFCILLYSMHASSFVLTSFKRSVFNRRICVGSSFSTLQNSTICGGQYTIVTPDDANIDAQPEFLPEERSFVNSVEHLKSRQDIFLCGRIALRRSIKALKLEDEFAQKCLKTPILRNTLGAPILPSGVSGSISHKNKYAIGIVRPNAHEPLGHWSDSLSEVKKLNKTIEYGHIGIDLEKCTSKAYQSLRERLLTENEQYRMEVDKHSNPLSEEEDVMLRFSFKEAIFKALNPTLKRYVEFGEMEVYPQPNGQALLNFCLKSGELFEYEACYKKWSPEPGSDYWITCVYLYHMHKLRCS